MYKRCGRDVYEQITRLQAHKGSRTEEAEDRDEKKVNAEFGWWKFGHARDVKNGVVRGISLVMPT